MSQWWASRLACAFGAALALTAVAVCSLRYAGGAMGIRSVLSAATNESANATASERCMGYHDHCPPYPEPYLPSEWPTEYNYSGEFPAHFVWGLGTAAYQIEGAYRDDGRGASIWDTFTGADTVGMPGADCGHCCKEAPCPINKGMAAKGATGNVACNHYRMMKSDVALMKSMGLKHYRFSISWPRLIPTGKASDGINDKAKEFYNNLIDALLYRDITPYVTLYHWDLPQGLLDPPTMNGWWSRDADGQPDGQILPHWLDYVETCFKVFGDRVKNWVTFNEPWTFSFLGSGLGGAPSIEEFNDPSVDPYIAAHNVLNAHAAAVDLYRRKYKKEQGGTIGITNNCDWREPASRAPADVAAAERSVLFQLGWFADPIFGGSGDYPKPMRRLLGDRLPRFTEEQRVLINGSSDFFGLNHYGAAWASSNPDEAGPDTAYAAISEDGFPQAQSAWLFSAPWGFRKMLNWVKRRYGNPPILVTESGWSIGADKKESGVYDFQRVQYYANYTSEMHRAIHEDGVDVRGFFAWSLMDNFEWSQGYAERFGVAFTDFAWGDDEHAPYNQSWQPTTSRGGRIRKDSSCWLETVWNTNALVAPTAHHAKCPPAGAMSGTFMDPNNEGCGLTLHVDFGGQTGFVYGSNGTKDDGCLGGKAMARTIGSTIILDFHYWDSSLNLLTGYWNRATRAMHWGNGHVWENMPTFPVVKKMNASKVSTSDPCPGYIGCTAKFPTPYEDRRYPDSYDITGKFPENFIWGLGTASYQIEGGYREGGRGASIWDTFTGADTVGMPGANCSYCCKEAPCEVNAGMQEKGATGNVACDHFHNWRSDVALMKSMGLKHYRFSIAWTRIVPTGRTKDGVNDQGVKFYNDLIDALIFEGIIPYVTLYHWDLPQGLLNPPKVNGWWSRGEDGQIVQDWMDYVEICFKEFGDRVKTWVTFNEPWSFTFLASGSGKAPGISEFGDAKHDPFVAAHNVLNAHAQAVDIYRRKYQSAQGGRIGITNNVEWREPKRDTPSDIAAAERMVLFQLGWFCDPIFGGKADYPAEMRRLYGTRLPRFSLEERRLLNGSADFFGLNHYGTGWAEYKPGEPGPDVAYGRLTEDGFMGGQSRWLHSSPWGFRKLLNWVNKRYPGYPIIVTEGGWSEEAPNASAAIEDNDRIGYYANYTSQMHKAITEDKVDVRGYFAWSFLDNFEWEQGYNERFGVVYTDYKFGKDKRAPKDAASGQPTTNQVRTRKGSSCWLEAVWTTNSLVDPASDAFSGCVTQDIFEGTYVDKMRPGCIWTVTIVPADWAWNKPEYALLEPTETGSGDGCMSPTVSGELSGGTLVGNFVSGPNMTRLSGFWNTKSKSIEWGDGGTWVKTTAEEADVRKEYVYLG